MFSRKGLIFSLPFALIYFAPTQAAAESEFENLGAEGEIQGEIEECSVKLCCGVKEYTCKEFKQERLEKTNPQPSRGSSGAPGSVWISGVNYTPVRDDAGNIIYDTKTSYFETNNYVFTICADTYADAKAECESATEGTPNNPCTVGDTYQKSSPVSCS